MNMLGWLGIGLFAGVLVGFLICRAIVRHSIFVAVAKHSADPDVEGVAFLIHERLKRELPTEWGSMVVISAPETGTGFAHNSTHPKALAALFDEISDELRRGQP